MREIGKRGVGSLADPSAIYNPMELGDKIIWSNHYGYEVAWLQNLKGSEASIKLISGTKKGATVSKPIEELERFSEELYEGYANKFGEKFGG